MKIAQLVRRSRVGRSTIHHYLNVGLLPPPKVTGVKLHLYGEEHLKRLAQIRRMRSAGFSLSEIRRHLEDSNGSDSGGHSIANQTGESEIVSLRDRVLRIATQLFLNKGYHAVRMEDVAIQCRISKATLYQIFASKEDLFIDCIEGVRFTVVPKETREGRRFDVLEVATERVRLVLQNFSTFRSLTNLLLNLIYSDNPRLSERARREYHWMITHLQTTLRSAMDKKIFREMDTETLAYMLWGALMGAGDRMSRDDQHSIEDTVRFYFEFVLEGILSNQALRRSDE